MKVVAFNVPQVKKEAFRLQIDRGAHFYDQLHQHPEIQIMLIEEGEGTLIAGDYVGRFAPGDLYVMGSGQAHVFRSDKNYFLPKTKLKSRAISIYFNENYLGDFWQLEEMKTIRKFAVRASRGIQIIGKVKVEVAHIIQELKNADGVHKLVLFLSLLRKLSESKGKLLAVSVSDRGIRKEESKRMNAILQFTFRESHRKVYLQEVADLANLSVEAFCRYFKIHTQKTYTSFLNEVRVSNACHLLIDKDLSVQDVCYQSGFSNVSNFNRIFKKVAGKQPAKYLG